MSNVRFSLPEYAERYEYIRRDLDQNLVTVLGDNVRQRKDNYTFTFEERSAIYDWSKGYFNVGVRLERLVEGVLRDGRAYQPADNVGLINGIHSLIRRISMQGPDGQVIYDVPEVNKALNIKKLLEYGPDYAETVGTNEMWYLDTKIGLATDDNTGFIARRDLFATVAGTQANGPVVYFRIPLKTYSFFESLDFNNVLLSGMSLKIIIDIESDANLILSAGAANTGGRVVLDQLELWVPQVTLHPSASEQYMRSIDKPIKWTYMRERVERSVQLTTQSGRFRITGVNKPRKVFFYFSQVAKDESLVFNMYAFDSMFTTVDGTGIGGDATMTRARLEFDDGSYYPHSEYVSNQVNRIYHDVQEYAHRNDDDCCGSQVTRKNFVDLFSVIYFDLDYQKLGTVSDNKDMTFIYNLTTNTAEPFYIYAVMLYSNDASFSKLSNRYTLFSEVSK